MAFRLSPQDEEALIAFLQDLVRTPSLSTQEGKVAARVAEEMVRVGFAQVFTDQMGSVVGRIGAGGGRKLLYNGHMDTVDVGDPSAWSRDPYGALIEGGILYGRGACDMKGGLAAMVYGARLLLDAGVTLDGDLYVAGVVQEEPCEGLAMRFLVEEEGLRPDFVVLGEPTDLQVARGHRGRMEMRVTVRGRACHASAPEQGENAVYAAARVIRGLEELAPRLAEDPFLGRGSLAVTHIESAAASRNAVPDLCAFVIDRRLTLGETEETALAEVEGVIQGAAVRAQVAVTEYQAISCAGHPCRARQIFPSWALPKDHPLVRTMAQAVKEALGYEPHIGRWGFSTDGAYTMGVAGIPTVGFGPGDERHAHTVEDQVRVEDVVKAARVYAQLAVELLRETES